MAPRGLGQSVQASSRPIPSFLELPLWPLRLLPRLTTPHCPLSASSLHAEGAHFARLDRVSSLAALVLDACATPPPVPPRHCARAAPGPRASGRPARANVGVIFSCPGFSPAPQTPVPRASPRYGTCLFQSVRPRAPRSNRRARPAHSPSANESRSPPPSHAPPRLRFGRTARSCCPLRRPASRSFWTPTLVPPRLRPPHPPAFLSTAGLLLAALFHVHPTPPIPCLLASSPRQTRVSPLAHPLSFSAPTIALSRPSIMIVARPYRIISSSPSRVFSSVLAFILPIPSRAQRLYRPSSDQCRNTVPDACFDL